MVKRAILSIVAVAGLTLAPVSAQETAAPTGQDDLDCAIFVASMMERAEKEGDQQVIMGLAAGMTYFIGRYEGQGGTDLKAAMQERVRQLSIAGFAALGAKCGPRMTDLGSRMQDAGKALIDAEAEAAAEAETAE